MLFTGWEVRFGINCARGLEYRRRPTAGLGRYLEGTVSPNTDRSRPVNNIFVFSFWDLKVSGKLYFSLQPRCVKVGRVRVDDAHDRLQTKTKHQLQHDFYLVIYIYLSQLRSL